MQWESTWCLQSVLINKANGVFFDTSLPSMRTVYSHATWHVLQHLEVSMVINYTRSENMLKYWA